VALDADYVLTDEFVDELARLRSESDINGYLATFRYCVWSRPLSGALYPPVSVLYRKGKARYVQEGHTQRVKVEGRLDNTVYNELRADAGKHDNHSVEHPK
jgi:hypothetical protein